VTLVRTDVSEELSASFIRVTTIGELGTMLAVTSIVPSSQDRKTGTRQDKTRQDKTRQENTLKQTNMGNEP
jgi:hypothetical protein